MQKRTIWFALLLGLSPAPLWADVADPLTGARVSLRALQEALSSPPLPSLEYNACGGLKLQGSYMEVKLNDNLPIGKDSSQALATKGEFYGWGSGMSITGPMVKGTTYFAFASYNQTHGGLSVKDTVGNENSELSGMRNEGVGLLLGISKRIAPSNTSPIAMGFFAGPTILHFKSQLTASNDWMNNSQGDYEAHPWSYGVMGGVQMGLRLGFLYINPYALYYQDLTNGCKRFTGPAATSGDGACSEGNNYDRMKMTFGAWGVNLGFWNFGLGVYSSLKNDKSMKSTAMKNYQLSYTFKF